MPLVRNITDVLLVYDVGHGMRTGDGQLALALTGTVADPEILSDSALVYPRLMEVLRGSPAATKPVILDCCHAELGLDAEYHFQSALAQGQGCRRACRAAEDRGFSSSLRTRSRVAVAMAGSWSNAQVQWVSVTWA
ncbi:hypothetical protein ACH4E7_34815 [Kitasatospora sp. NPDC018058]|uniref:hypothetical protein n=1 Tax=Kitasatospora sp. NPDC018058 TaxID=3364025 RepID=UPI0037C10D93